MTEQSLGRAAVIRFFLRACVLACLLAAGCFRVRTEDGGETHFLRRCDGSCVGGLSCVCGVCTKPCEASAACKGLASVASCVMPAGDAMTCESGGASGLLCDVSCKSNAQCAGLGTGFECGAGRCRERGATSAVASDAASSGVSEAGASQPDAGVCEITDAGGSCGFPPVGDGGVQGVQPLVMLLVDSSGSQERKWDCSCTTPACDECLPDCTNGERSRWIGMLEALTGTFRGFNCQALERTAANGSTYDLGYYLPHIAPKSSGQDEDGVLDLYAKRLRFGMATFDTWDSYVGAPPLVSVTDFDFSKSVTVDGLWSYNPERALRMPLRRPDGSRIGQIKYPNSTTSYYMDTGIRGPQATEGAVLVASGDVDALAVNARIQASLQQVRPYGGTPIAAAFDDLYYYLWGDLAMQGERANATRRDLVLITDGYPDDDYRSYGCDCATTESPSDPTYCGGPPNDPSMIHCPYPTPEQTAHTLRCGSDEACDGGVVERVYVVGFAIDDADTQKRLDAIAQEGGSTAAHMAPDPQSLRSELQTIFEEIAAPQ